jgi:hypothetical protein
LKHTDSAVLGSCRAKSRCAHSRINGQPLPDCSTYIFENQLSETGHAPDAGMSSDEMGCAGKSAEEITSG